MFLTRFEFFSVPSRNPLRQTDRQTDREPEREAVVPCVAFLPWLWAMSSGSPCFIYWLVSARMPTAPPSSDVATVNLDGDKALRGIGYFLMLSQCSVGTSGVSSRPKTLPSPHGWTPGHELGQALPLCCCSLSHRDDPAPQPARVSLFLFYFFFIFNSDPESAQVKELSLSWFKETTSHV